MKPIYVGPSWAARSFETADDSDVEITNLFLEWNIEVQNLSKCALTNGMLIERVKHYLSQNTKDKSTPIIWVFAEPLTDSFRYNKPKIEDILERDDWWEIRNNVRRYLLDEIASLGNPIGLIGAHSDIPLDCDYKNVTVIHPSWQKFLAEYIGIEIKEGWGADVAHRFIVTDRSIRPSHSVIDAVAELFFKWHKLEMHDLFQICHPNIQGNKIFAEFIESNVKQWLSQFN